MVDSRRNSIFQKISSSFSLRRRHTVDGDSTKRSPRTNRSSSLRLPESSTSAGLDPRGALGTLNEPLKSPLPPGMTLEAATKQAPNLIELEEVKPIVQQVLSRIFEDTVLPQRLEDYSEMLKFWLPISPAQVQKIIETFKDTGEITVNDFTNAYGITSVKVSAIKGGILRIKATKISESYVFPRCEVILASQSASRSRSSTVTLAPVPENSLSNYFPRARKRSNIHT